MMDLDVSLPNLLRRRARRTPDRAALTFEGHTYTFASLQTEVETQATAFTRFGIGPGDRVAFLGLNQPEFLISLFAAAHLGAIFVPINYRLVGSEIAIIVNDAGAKLLIVDPPHQAVVDGIRAVLPSDLCLISVGPAPEGWRPMTEDSDRPGQQVAGTADDVAIIMYTSGTTGRPKGAMLTHRNLWVSNVSALMSVDLREDDVTLTVAPLFHIGGLNVLTLATWLRGGEVVLLRAFDAGEVLEAIVKKR